VAIDIPIGLPMSGARACDLAARRALGPGQGSRVFPVPARGTLEGNSYEECSELNRRASGTGISKQTFAIMPKIIEVDRWISRVTQARVREVHPEVCFRVLNGAPLAHSKKDDEGRRERLAILARHGVVFDPLAERKRLASSRVGVDDLIDAAVALVTARRISEGTAAVLGDGARDGRGLRMEIVA
jgi:predicted RNase H-like nuclease